MSEPVTPAAPNLAILKGITAALGLLLVGGVALLCVLLFTGGADRDGSSEVASATPGYVITVGAGERIGEIDVNAEGGAWLITGGEGNGRIVFVSAHSGQMTTVSFDMAEGARTAAPRSDD